MTQGRGRVRSRVNNFRGNRFVHDMHEELFEYCPSNFWVRMKENSAPGNSRDSSGCASVRIVGRLENNSIERK